MTDKINGNILNLEQSDYFNLTENFIGQYEDKQPEWGKIGYVTYKRTYARPVGARNEEFWEGLKRVVEGIYTIQKWHCRRLGLPFNGVKAQASAQTMFKLIWEFKFCPSRGFWGMHLPLLDKVGAAPLYNCGTATTKDIKIDFSNPFCWLMDFLMLGVGISSDTRGAGLIKIVEPRVTQGLTYMVPDTREGWVELLGIILDSYAGKGTMPEHIDYSIIRPAGAPLITMGGIAPGPEPLKMLVKEITTMLDLFIDRQLNSQGIVDLCNMIAKCVVSGNIRRSAVLMLGEAGDIEFMQLKDFNKFPAENKAYRWCSNNSIKHIENMDYSWLADNAAMTGELPGVLFLENAKKYGRMIDPKTDNDTNIINTNPCLSGDQKLLIWDGTNEVEKTFEELAGQQVMVKTHTNKIVPGKVWYTGNKDTIELLLHSYGKIKLTPDHLLMDALGNKVAAKNCKGKRLRIYNDRRDDHDELWVKLGFIQGDGCTTELYDGSQNSIKVCFNSKDSDVRELFRISDFKNCKPRLQGYRQIMENHGFSAEKLPKRRLPIDLPKDKELAFLKGLFSANGWVNNEISLRATCKPMLLQVQKILAQYKIDSCIGGNDQSYTHLFNGKLYNCNPIFGLHICRIRSISLFYELIGFIHNYKMTALKEVLVARSPKVTSIKKAGIQKVYDFSAPGVGWGIVNGVIVSNCGEIFLEDRELCNILETFPSRHTDYAEYEKTLKYAYLYTKTVTLIPTHDTRTNAVMMKNRRIGISQTGVVESFERHGHREHFKWCDQGYKYLRNLDNSYSDWLAIPKSKKITTIKPSGTVSLLPGVTSGIHYPPAQYYYKLMRVGKLNPILKNLETAGYRIEDLKSDQTGNTVVVYFPIKCNYYSKSDTDVSIWRQLENTAKMQYYWADNSVSVTIKYKPEEMTEIKDALELYESRLKSVSFMPVTDHAYEQAPWISMTEAEYEVEISHLKTLRLKRGDHHDQDEKYCTSDTCII